MTGKVKASKELARYYPFKDYEITYLLDYLVASGQSISSVINLVAGFTISTSDMRED